jgi:CRP/FNR family transcriptional regulator
MALSGREQVLCLVGPRTCFGGCPVFDGDTYPVTAQAVDEVTLYILPRTEALALAEQSPEAARIMLQVFGARLRHLTQVAERLALQGVVDRLATLLAEYADERGTPTGDGVRLCLDLTQDDLAALLGTARQTVNRAFLRLERQGAIKARRRQVCIINPHRLRQLAPKV